MNDVIDISIVVVNYNVKDFLNGCLKSIEDASHNLSVETIVVDNNSVDGSVEYLMPLFPNVEFIALADNLGFAKANNIGIEKSRGKYVLILNPDTLLRSDTLDEMYRYMENEPECGIAGCKVLNPDGTFQVACRRGFPTPWAAFSKLFGLQSMFPKSKLFSSYNQLYRSIDETYPVDAVIGAFMFCRRDILLEVGGFDTEFFMYGEDLDLCRQVSLRGKKVMYVHTTSIIHYKGESTKRSSINDVKHFYEAMEIFTRKHFGSSHIFLFILKIGIWLRSLLAYTLRSKRDIMFIVMDLLSINLALIISTKIRFESFFGFPDYAYPIVFIVVSLVFLLSMFAVGEYFEGRNSVRKAFVAAMMSFFALSSLTYFFPDFRFSRGVVLMSIGLVVGFVSISRGVAAIFDKLAGRERDRKIIIVGTGDSAIALRDAIINKINSNVIILGYVDTGLAKSNSGLNILGEKSYLKRIIEKHKPNEVIFSDDSISPSDMINLMIESSNSKVRFHQVKEYDELLAAQIIDDISGIEPTVPKYNLSKFRNITLKRFEDVVISMILLTIGLPFLLAFKSNKAKFIKNIFKVLSGKISFIGLHKVEENDNPAIGKIGIIGPSATENPDHLSIEAIKKLNDYYVRHYSLSLDFDIIIKYLIRT